VSRFGQVVVREQHPQLYWTWGTVSFAFVGSVIALKVPSRR
jgi:hypothetical protein